MWFHVYKVATLIVLSTLTKGDLPEDDFRIVHRQDLLGSDSDVFEDNDSKSFSQLLFDVARDQVIVGARDALYRLSLRGLRVLERSPWPAPSETIQMCQNKGQTEEDCHNYIKVLLSYGHKLFACGTNAFSPVCTWREVESINTVMDTVTGIANCPYNPHSNVTAILTSTGEYYAGTPTDFTSSDTAITKSRGAAIPNIGILRTQQYDLNWLNEPQFVGSFEDDTFVYFVFREVAVEYMNCGKAVYSRIARVCKNEYVSHRSLDNWSTFLKARLTCSVPGDVPFYYDEVQSVQYLDNDKILIATFTTPTNSIAGSAICIYNMSDIQASFDGPYKVQRTSTSMWAPSMPSNEAKDHFQCQLDNRPQQLKGYDRYYLMYEPIEPISGEPVYKLNSERFTLVTSDVTSAKGVDKQYVLYVATDNSDVLKLSIRPGLDGACLLQIWRLRDKDGGHRVMSMQFVKDTMSVYIGTDTSVVRLSAARCAGYQSRAACVGAADPHCVWDSLGEVCLKATNRWNEHSVEQNTLACGVNQAKVDGGWSAWSAWEDCMQHGSTNSAYGEEPDLCLCRRRACDNPAPAHGGAPCKGASISVSNCTVHGGWTAWSAWSACSATCGIGAKSRRRACAAPAPRGAGRACVGLAAQHVFCSLPPCADPLLAPIDGGWSAWGPWSTCAGAGGPGCGPAAGWRERRRVCNNPAPAHGGADCDGSKTDREICDMKPCDVKKAAAWTPWVQVPGNTTDGSYTEKRFKFLCKAPSSEQLKLSLAREEERYCTSEGSCSNTPISSQAGARSPCGRHGCNTQNKMAEGEWSCWSEWSSCAASCGAVGSRSRTRSCLSGHNCHGAAVETAVCKNYCDTESPLQSPSQWSIWSPWSPCIQGRRTRHRKCVGEACTGPSEQAVSCGDDDDDDDVDNELYAMPAYTGNVEMASFVTMDRKQNLSVGAIVACVVASFIMGCLLCLAAVVYLQRKGKRMPWRKQTRVPSSPHYITAKQNSYVTVPLKDVPRKAKRQPSFTGIGGASGLVLSKSNNINVNRNSVTTPKLYPKAIANEYDSMGTLKRHSNQPNNKTNIDMEEDKFY